MSMFPVIAAGKGIIGSWMRYKDQMSPAGIDKRTFHKIRSDFGYKPSRMTAFRCCIGLKLDVAEAEELLRLAGMAFSPNDPDDLVIKFCLEKGIKDIPGINYMLYTYATRPLEKGQEHIRKAEALMRDNRK